MKKIFIVLLVLATNVFSQSASIVLLHKTLGGDGSYENPYILDTDIVKWTHNISGENKETARYMTCSHAAIGRACILQYKRDDMDFNTMKNTTHSIKLFCGTYYIRTHVNGVMTSKIFIQCQTPPVDSYSVPYTPPASNVAPNPVIRLMNISNGSGTYENPFVIAGNIVQFYVNDSHDGNGVSDIEKGAWFWAIVTDGWHPVYSKGEQVEDVKKTFSYYDEFNDLQKWDTTQRPSSNDKYKLTLYFFDRYGVRNLETIQFTCDGGLPPPSVPELTVNPLYLNFNGAFDALNFNVRNSGTSNLTWNSSFDHSYTWIKSIVPLNGNLGSGDNVNVTVTIDRSGLGEGNYAGLISITSNVGNEDIEIFMSINIPPQPPQNVQIVTP